MVTKADALRLPYIKRSVRAYIAQSWPDKELVVVLDPREAACSDAVVEHVVSLARPDIRVVAPTGPLALGGLRNRAVREARGDILCQWDDDDLHHPERIARQYEAMRSAGRKACYLQDVLQYLAVPREIYWTNWLNTEHRVHPGTMMCDRDTGLRYPESGPDSQTSEDLHVLAALQREGHVHALAGQPHLFVYVTHGFNVWPPAHHRMLVDRLSLSSGLLRRREALIRNGLGAFDFGDGTIAVMSSNGLAFRLPAQSNKTASGSDEAV